MKKLIISAAAAAACLAPTYVTSSPPAARTIYLTIRRIAQNDNLDADFLRADRADFYAQVAIAGVWRTSNTVHGKDVIWPSWRFSRTTGSSPVRIHLRIYDNDGGLEGRDDRCDVNPLTGARELSFTYNPATGRISGDASGFRGEPIHVKGFGDANRAEVTFVVNHG
jgi:hypothetical protein